MTALHRANDRGVDHALTNALGAGPWADDQLRSIEGLEVHGAADLSLLTRCTGLRQLRLVGSTVASLSGLPLGHLMSLDVFGCALQDVSALRDAPALETVGLRFTLVSGLEPLLTLPRGLDLVVDGCPLDPEARKDLAAAATGSGGVGGTRVCPGEHTHAAGSAELVGRGHHVVMDLTAGGRTLAVSFDDRVRWWNAHPVGLVTASRRTRGGTSALLEEASRAGVITPLPEGTLPEAAPFMETAHAEEALGWLQGLERGEALELGAFIRNFQSQLFYRFPHGDPRFEVDGVPGWFRERLRVLAGVGPVEANQVQFIIMEELAERWLGEAPWFEWMTPPQSFFVLRHRSYGRLVPIAFDEGAIAALALSSNPEERAILLARLPTDDSTDVPDPHAFPLFDSYAHMLASIEAVRPYGQPPIRWTALE